jgi:uncharacterized protein
MSGMYQEFLRRASRIPFLGLGLSVDLYSPAIFELCDELHNRHIPIAYLEIFHAVPEALEIVRARLLGLPLVYHAEGLWFTQPDWDTRYFSQKRLGAAVRNLQILQSHWVNQECATKEMAGFAFGTYLPPLFTEASAEVTAYHTWKAQQRLDGYDWGQKESSPLLLLEVPPLSYFSIGDISYSEFFAKVTAMAPCGLVLDLGHVWTVYRYTGAWRNQNLATFFEAFLKQFPLERVIQIHIAGLDYHPEILNRWTSETYQNPPLWIDAHEASIPGELFELLIRVVQDPRLVNLKGIALEVDGKHIPLICREIQAMIKIVNPLVYSRLQVSMPAAGFQKKEEPPIQNFTLSTEIRQILTSQYRNYIALVTGKMKNGFDFQNEWDKGAKEELHFYTTKFLPHEIKSWGGDVRVMFPQTCQLLDQHKISVNQFVDFWFACARASETEYDFFLFKIQRFVEFLDQVLPHAHTIVKQEADFLFQGYMVACQGSPP